MIWRKAVHSELLYSDTMQSGPPDGADYDAEYYARKAKECREKASAATDPKAKDAFEAIAREYERRRAERARSK